MAFLLSSAYMIEVMKDSPLHWWRLGEPQGATTAFDRIVGGQDFTYFDSPHPGNSALVTSDANTSVRFDHTLPDRIEYSGGNIITSFPFTLEAVIQTNGPNDNFYRVIYTEDYVHDAQQAFTFRVGDSFAPGGAGCVGGGFSDMTLGNQVGATSSVRVDDGLVHHVAVVFTNNTTVKVYVDGVDRTVIQATNASYTIPTVRYRAAIGNIPLEIPNTGSFGLDGSMQDCVLYNTSLSATRIAAHAAAVSTPWNGDTPGQRMGRLLDAINWPSDARAISAGSSVLQTTPDLTGKRALEAMQTVADSEMGKLYVNAWGGITFEGRDDGINQPIKAAFVDAHNTQVTYVDPSKTNLLSTARADMESGVSGWTALSNCSIAQTTAQANHGSASLQMTSTAAGTMDFDLSALDFTVNPGTTYYAVVAFRAKTVGRSCSILLDWLDASFGFISEIAGSTVTDVTTGWTTATVSGVAPANAKFVNIIPLVTATAAAGEVHYADTVGLFDNPTTSWVLPALQVQVAAPEYTDQLIKNDVAIQRIGGVRQVFTDAASIAVYQDQGYEKTGLYHNSDDTSRSIAAYIVGQYKDPLQRISQLTFKPRESVAAMQLAVSLELTDWATVTYTPQGVGSAFSQTTVIEGIKHNFSPKDWTTTLQLSPADTKTYWQLGVTGFGELGVNTRLFF